MGTLVIATRLYPSGDRRQKTITATPFSNGALPYWQTSGDFKDSSGCPEDRDASFPVVYDDLHRRARVCGVRAGETTQAIARISGGSGVAQTVAESLDRRRRGWRRRRSARPRVDHASALDTAAERDTIHLEGGAAGARIRRGRRARRLLGRAGSGLRVAAARTRHLRRRSRQRLAGRRRREGC